MKAASSGNCVIELKTFETGGAMSQFKPAQVPQTSAGEELQIVQRALSGDPDALSALFARDRRRLYHAAFSLLHNREDAEDALQDGLLSAYLNLESFEGRSRFSTWLTRIVLNSALMNRRRLRARPFIDPQQYGAGNAHQLIIETADTRHGPETIYSLNETRKLVRKSIIQLPPLLRSAFYLTDIKELSAAEAAAAVGIKSSAMKSRTSRARRRLTRSLDKRVVSY
jgi:RNA polymerase sigma-70 factor (ECF subfamily)